ncbi:hypothetical protein D3C77_282240 [compost metagenome]
MMSRTDALKSAVTFSIRNNTQLYVAIEANKSAIPFRLKDVRAVMLYSTANNVISIEYAGLSSIPYRPIIQKDNRMNPIGSRIIWSSL